jgi:Holliday junction resolvase RusA-like endonuclease
MQEHTWSVLLRPFVPPSPVTGPVELDVRMVYPHNKGTKLGDRVYLLPKDTRPDADNAAKHLIDLLSRMRFIENDAKVARLVVEKFHGPESHVGIQITIQPTSPQLPGAL